MSTLAVPFDKAATDETGGNPKVQRRHYLPAGSLPVIDQGQTEIAGYTGDLDLAYRGELPVVLFGDHTRALKYVDRPFALGADGVKVLQPRDGFSAKFLYYYWLASDIPNHGYSRHFKFLKDIAIPVFAPSEQRRIVEILDQADALRKLRREADAKAARMLPALFLKMFGDPATNPMGWPEVPLSKTIALIEPGWSSRSELRPRQDDELGVLKVSAVTSGRFLPKENKAVTSIIDGGPLVTPRRGDLLFSRANTRELVAATCLVEEDHPKLFLSDKLWRITANTSSANNVFLKFLLANEFVRDTIRARASGSSGSMLNVSQQAVLGTVVPVPDTDVQNVFEKQAWAVMAVMRNAETAASQVDFVWRRLMDHAFSGQLTAKWRQAHMQELLIEMQEQARLLNLPAPN